MNDFTTNITVSKSAEEAFNAINNVAAWWQGDIQGQSHQTDNEFEYRMKHFHYSKQKVTEMVPYSKIVWQITDSDLSSFTHQQEWTGTTIRFELTENNGKTDIRFTHSGLTPKFECYGDCSGAWTALMQKSLYSLIETGKGIDVF